MVFNKLFFRFYRYLTFKGIRNSYNAEPDVSKWHDFIFSMKEPSDDIERAYCRFLCRKYYFSPFYIFLGNTASFIALLFSVPIIFRKKRISNYSTNIGKNGVLLVKVSKEKEFDVGYNDILPSDLEKKYGEIKYVIKPNKKDWYLSPDAKELLLESLKRRPWQFLLNYWIFRELCFYSYLLDYYNPNAIAVYVNERNVAGPVISLLCEKKGVDFVSFMHGEYILQLIQGFIRFTKFYVWDEHYVKMFTEDLRCDPKQFVIYSPQKYKGLCKPRESNKSYEYYATYYFGDESKEIIEKVAEAFRRLKKINKICKIRPHPRAINLKYINEAFKNIYVEDPYTVKLADSLECSRFIIALNSTVLSEAFYSQKEIVIDDYSDYEAYNNLKNRKYIMTYKPHRLLTELLSGSVI